MNLNPHTAIDNLSASCRQIQDAINLAQIKKEIESLENKLLDQNIWSNTKLAKEINSTLAYKKAQVETIMQIESRIQDARVLLELADENNDLETLSEVDEEIKNITADLFNFETQTFLNSPWDPYPALLTIRAGAGGVDAADFADMLHKMYLKWADKKNFDVQIIDISFADIAGIKSVTMEIDAPYAFGCLAFESGTHRLVRMSPFNSANSRETSFAAVEVIPLFPESEDVKIDEKEIKIDVYRSSGPGGQSVNTTDSAVRITHLPTGIIVSCQNEKSQLQNKITALSILKSRLLVLQKEQENAQKKEFAGNITASWGDQIRSYVLAPYKLVKDLRTGYKTSNTERVFSGSIDDFINAGIRHRANKNLADSGSLPIQQE